MKNLIKILSLLLFMSAVTFIACNKENALVEVLEEENNTTTQVQQRHYAFNADIQKLETGLDEYGILSFDNKESYLETLEQLESLSNKFMEEITDFENEDLNYYQVLSDFANQLNFNSLFVDIYDKEQKWLEETDGSDINEDPDNHFVSDYYERSLYNINSEVVVNKKIYKKLATGHLIINSLNFDLLASLREKLDLYNLPEGVEYVGDLPTAGLDGGRIMVDCATMKKNSDFKPNNFDTFRIKWITELNSPLFSERNVKATTKNYRCKKLKNGVCKKWKSAGATTTSRIYGEVSSTYDSPNGWGSADCAVLMNLDGISNTQFSNSVNDKEKIGYRRAKTGIVFSDHSGVAGITHTNTLTW